MVNIHKSLNHQVSGDGVDEMQSYASACTLIASGLADHLTIVLDWRANPVAANLAARNVPKVGLLTFSKRILSQNFRGKIPPFIRVYCFNSVMLH